MCGKCNHESEVLRLIMELKILNRKESKKELSAKQVEDKLKVLADEFGTTTESLNKSKINIGV